MPAQAIGIKKGFRTMYAPTPRIPKAKKAAMVSRRGTEDLIFSKVYLTIRCSFYTYGEMGIKSL